MFLSLIAGIVAFALTVFAMPHFIRIYQLEKNRWATNARGCQTTFD